jgi:hypothetical protein
MQGIPLIDPENAYAVAAARRRLRPYLEACPDALAVVEDDRAIDQSFSSDSRVDPGTTGDRGGPRLLLYRLTRYYDDLRRAFGIAQADKIKQLRGGGDSPDGALPNTWAVTPRAWLLSRL